MKTIVGVLTCALLVGMVVPAMGAVVWSQNMEGAFSAVTGNRDDRNESSVDEAPWDTSAYNFVSGTIADGFYASLPGWNGATWTTSASNFASQGVQSMKLVTGSGDYRDIWLGIKITGLTAGQTYTLGFDMAMDKSKLVAGGGNPGAVTGADHVTSISYNIRNTLENTLEIISSGLMTPKAFADCEDYPGHLRNSVWLGDPALWNGSFHTITNTFTPDGANFGGDVALVIKIRQHQAPTPSSGYYLDNLVVTPEPASLAILALGGLLVMRRRK